MKTKIYISGKISGLSKCEYMLNFEETKLLLFANYDCNFNDIINPIEIKPFLGIKKWLFFMISDIWQLKKCTHIALMPNWIDSRGAVTEYIFAKWIFKQQIIFL